MRIIVLLAICVWSAHAMQQRGGKGIKGSLAPTAIFCKDEAKKKLCRDFTKGFSSVWQDSGPGTKLTKAIYKRLFRPVPSGLGKNKGTQDPWTQDIGFLMSGNSQPYCNGHFTCAEIDKITTGYSDINNPWKDLSKVKASSSMGAIDLYLKKVAVPRDCNAAELAARTATCQTEAKEKAAETCTAQKVKKDCKAFDVTKSCGLLHPRIVTRTGEGRAANVVPTEKTKIVDMSNLGIYNECTLL